MNKNAHVNLRALKLIHSFCRRWIFLLNADIIFGAVSPYYNIILSSMLLNEIVGSRNKRTLIILICVLIAGNFIISVTKNILGKFLNQAVYEREKNEARILGAKNMKIDYRTIESTDYRQLRRRVDENGNLNGQGKYALLNILTGLEYNIFTLAIAAYLFTDMIVHILSDGFEPMFLMFIALIAALSLANIFISKWRQKKEIYMSGKVGQGLVDENRYDGAIDSYHMGKDTRIYCQDKIILSMKEKYLLTDHFNNFRWMFRKVFRYSFIVNGGSHLLKFSIYLFIIYYIIHGKIEIGGLIKYVGFVEMFSSSISGIVTGKAGLKENTKYVSDYMKQFEYENTEKDMGEPINETEIEAIEFIHVSFHYPDSEKYIFNNLSFKIKAGQRTAIVGVNGSGKTTLIKLICRLYKPTAGEIRVNGRNIWDIQYEEYISRIAAVFQDFKLFSFSLGQNIALDIEYDREKADACLIKAGLNERFPERFNRLDTYLYKDFEEKGVEISGGEAQKIALARALYKDASLIILDEPTAALDPKAEYEIYTKFNEIVGSKTAIYISHRLSSCRFCDDIIVLDGGGIAQRGAHSTLVRDIYGKYYALWHAQAQYYS